MHGRAEKVGRVLISSKSDFDLANVLYLLAALRSLPLLKRELTRKALNGLPIIMVYIVIRI